MNESDIDLLRMAREIVIDGGDPSPCELGPYCLRCCIGIAKDAYDEKHPSGLGEPTIDQGAIMAGLPSFASIVFESDLPLVRVRDAIGAHDKGIAHTKESAIALLDNLIKEHVRESTIAN